MNILYLITDAYGSLGGISQFNRDFLCALNASSIVSRVHAVPRVIQNAIEDEIPEAVVFDRKAAKGKARFTIRAFEHACRDSAVDLVICGHINILPIAFWAAKLRGAPIALIMHGIDVWQPTRHHFANRLARSLDAYISVSWFTAEKFCRWSGVDKKRFTIVPNCVNLARFAPQPRQPSLVSRYGLEGCRVILTVGRLAEKERYKGFDEVLDALPSLTCQFPGLKYLIVGDGADWPRLMAKAEILGIAESVVFTGRISEEEKIAHFNLADAYVMPSYGEGFGIVLLEAAACGIPVIGSNADGSQEALMGGQLGTLVDPHKPGEIIDAITRVLERKGERKRPAGIETFGVDQFQMRIDRWLHEQARLKRGEAA